MENLRGKFKREVLSDKNIVLRMNDNILGGKKMKTSVLAVMVCVMAVVNFTSAVNASTSTQLFFEDFTGTALDTSLWSVFVDGNGQSHKPYVAGGLLHSQGYHTRIDSIPTFAAPEAGQRVIARARIRLAGEIQKFGFAPNPNERPGPIAGYYFDTVDFGGGAQVHYIRAVAWFQPASGPFDVLLDVEIPVTWYEFHEFAIERTPSEVIYSIDGQEVARVADSFEGALPVGVWNDRWSLMQTDWVEVVSVSELPLTVEVDIKPSSCPNPLNVKSKGVLPVAVLGSEDFDVFNIDPASIRLEGVAPVRSSYEDVAAPVSNGADDCDCTTEGPDGYLDLVLKFDAHEIVAALGGVYDGDVYLLILTGETIAGTPIEGTDCVVIIAK